MVVRFIDGAFCMVLLLCLVYEGIVGEPYGVGGLAVLVGGVIGWLVC